MTPKQRARIYRKAAEWLHDKFDTEKLHGFYADMFGGSHWITGCCYAIGRIAEIAADDVKDRDYPELFMMKPDDVKTWWWGHTEKEPRILALLLCEQIALNP